MCTEEFWLFIIESTINGLIALVILVLSIWIYLYLEKKKYMQENKIKTYSTMVRALKEYFMAIPSGEELKELNQEEFDQRNEERRKAQDKIGQICERLLFYGSPDVYRRIFDLFAPIESGKVRIHVKKLEELIIDMIHEIDPKRDIKIEDIFYVTKDQVMKFIE